MTFCGRITLPSDFDILRPFSSTVKPWVSTPLYGAWPFCATDVSSELWNQPRCWSEPSRYRSAGVRISGNSCDTQWCDTPESTHTSMMSVTFS